MKTPSTKANKTAAIKATTIAPTIENAEATINVSEVIENAAIEVTETHDDQTGMTTVTLSTFIAGHKTLAEIKEALLKDSSLLDALPHAIQKRAMIEGVYRLLSADTAGSKQIIPDAIEIGKRLEKGFWSKRDEMAAQKAATESATKGKTGAAKYTRAEWLGAIRDNTPEEKHAALKKVEILDDLKFAAFIANKVKDTTSIVFLAGKQLDERAEEKAKTELDKMLSEFESIDL